MAVTGGAKGVKLLGLWSSPFVWRAKIALNIKGVSYENSEEVFGSKSKLLLESNPIYKKVPVLIHDGNPICESMIIVQYIQDVWGSTGPTILPSDPYERALARFWSVYIDDKWFPHLFGLLKAKTEEDKAEAAEQVISGLQLLEDAFKQSSKGKGYFAGDAVGYLDIALGCAWPWIKVAEQAWGLTLLDEAKTPRLIEWAERFHSDDAVKGVVPEIIKLVEFWKMLLASWNAN